MVLGAKLKERGERAKRMLSRNPTVPPGGALTKRNPGQKGTPE